MYHSNAQTLFQQFFLPSYLLTNNGVPNHFITKFSHLSIPTYDSVSLFLTVSVHRSFTSSTYLYHLFFHKTMACIIIYFFHVLIPSVKNKHHTLFWLTYALCIYKIQHRNTCGMNYPLLFPLLISLEVLNGKRPGIETTFTFFQYSCHLFIQQTFT